jgi:hypothetical protein
MSAECLFPVENIELFSSLEWHLGADFFPADFAGCQALFVCAVPGVVVFHIFTGMSPVLVNALADTLLLAAGDFSFIHRSTLLMNEFGQSEYSLF